jgi:Outer membrane protein beta-barrel domain
MSTICATIVRCAVAVQLTLLFCTLAVHGQTPQSTSSSQLCFPRTTAPPDIANRTDASWANAFLYYMNTPSGTSPNVVLRGLRATDTTVSPPQDYIYLSIDAANLDSVLGGDYQQTLVVLAFDPGDTSGGASDDSRVQRIHISPVRSDATFNQSGAQFPAKVEYWAYGRNTGTNVYNDPKAAAFQNGTLGPTTSPSWLLNSFKVAYYRDGTNNYHWYLGMKIPVRSSPNASSTVITGNEMVQIPATGLFGFYVDVFPVKQGAGGNHNFWPANWPLAARPTACPTSSGNCTATAPVTSCTADCMTPAPILWGKSPVSGTACGGISIGSQTNDIFTNNSPNSKICIQAGVSGSGQDQFTCSATPNIFSATVHNSMKIVTGTSTTGQTATNVQATFYITDWGITNSLTPVGVSNNPTTPPVSVPPGDSTPFVTGSWLPIPNADDFDPTKSTPTHPTHPHQCVVVKLTAASGSNAVFLNDTAQRNMDFVNASRFSRNADISSKGYPPRLKPDGTPEADQLFDLRVTMHQEVLNAGALAPGNPVTAQSGEKRGRVVSQLTWEVDACRHTGLYMAVTTRKLELCEPVGSFGYVVRHAGNAPVRGWRVRLTGTALNPQVGNVYALHIPQEGVATVKTSIEPIESKWALFFDAGAAFPHGTFGSAVDTGFSLNTGVEYMATDHLSAEGIFGYHHFPGTLNDAANLFQVSANAKSYLTTGSLRPFVNGGIGGYKFSSGDMYFGANVGGGILYSITSHLGLEGRYNFHAVNTPAEATRFSTIQGGIRYEF